MSASYCTLVFHIDWSGTSAAQLQSSATTARCSSEWREPIMTRTAVKSVSLGAEAGMFLTLPTICSFVNGLLSYFPKLISCCTQWPRWLHRLDCQGTIQRRVCATIEETLNWMQGSVSTFSAEFTLRSSQRKSLFPVSPLCPGDKSQHHRTEVLLCTSTPLTGGKQNSKN